MQKIHIDRFQTHYEILENKAATELVQNKYTN